MFKPLSNISESTGSQSHRFSVVSLRIIIAALILIGLAFLATSIFTHHNKISQSKKTIGRELLAIAQTTAATMDHKTFEDLFLPEEIIQRGPSEYENYLHHIPADSGFAGFRSQLEKIIQSHQQLALGADNVYAFVVDPFSGNSRLRWALMTHEQPFTGEVYNLRPDARDIVTGRSTGNFTDVYFSEASKREWISACSPIYGSDGRVIGIVEAARDVEDILAETNSAANISLLLMIVSLILAVIAISALGYMFSRLSALVGGLQTEIRHRSEVEAALAKNEEKYRTLFDSIADPVIVFNRETLRFVDCNAAVARKYGYSREEFLQMTPLDLHPQDEVEKVARRIRTANTNRGNLYHHQTKDGRFFPVEIVTGEIDYQGTPAWISIVRDMTERQRIEDELTAAKESAEAANQIKSEFLANMSHEIRTPMNGILGMTELALEMKMSDEQRQYLELAHSSAESLLTVINDILDFSKIEANKLDLDPIEFKLRDHLTGIMKTMSVRAHQKDLEITYFVDPDLPDDLIGDPGRIRQILTNLIGNSVKFTTEGEIVVIARREEARKQDEVSIHFSVIDTGIGIPAEKQKLIFKAFSQADGSMTRKFGGTGLGLSISSQLVDLMGGKIWVESPVKASSGMAGIRKNASKNGHPELTEEHAGSAFHFNVCLRLQDNPVKPAKPVQIDRLKDMPVLIVDDNQTNRYLLEETARDWGVSLTMADDGEIALQKMEIASKAGNPFQLILIDQQMPKMDGFQLAEMMSGKPELTGSVIMMLTSVGQRGAAARCKHLGVAGYLVKPVSPLELQEAVLAVLGEKLQADREPRIVTRHSLREARSAHSDENNQIKTANWRPLNILVAEDNPVNQRLITSMMEKVGHQVVLTNNGREALQSWRDNEFDLILMDVQMPEMNGLESVEAIRREEKKSGEHVPVIALTAHSMSTDRDKCLAAGMDNYVSKPIDRGALNTVIADLVFSRSN